MVSPRSSLQDYWSPNVRPTSVIAVMSVQSEQEGAEHTSLGCLWCLTLKWRRCDRQSNLSGVLPVRRPMPRVLIPSFCFTGRFHWKVSCNPQTAFWGRCCYFHSLWRPCGDTIIMCICGLLRWTSNLWYAGDSKDLQPFKQKRGECLYAVVSEIKTSKCS